MSLGILYVATGQRYFGEALAAVESTRRVVPQVPIALATDIEVSNDLFDHTVIVENPLYNRGDKILGIMLSPFERTLFLDTDTHTCADFTDMFQLLDRFDIAVAHTQSRPYFHQEDIPDSFQDYSTGVILFRKSPEFSRFIQQWLNIYREHCNIVPSIGNQPAFRRALYYSNLRVATLTQDFHCAVGVGFLREEIKIAHGRARLREAAALLNRYPSYQRVFISTTPTRGQRIALKHRKIRYPDYVLHIFYWARTRTLHRRIADIVNRYGWVGMLRYVGQKLHFLRNDTPELLE